MFKVFSWFLIITIFILQLGYFNQNIVFNTNNNNKKIGINIATYSLILIIVLIILYTINSFQIKC